MKWLLEFFGKIKILAMKIHITSKLRGLSPDENAFVDMLISLEQNEDIIVAQVKALRLGKQIENLKYLLKEAGYGDGQINDLIKQYMPDLASKKKIGDLLKFIKLSHPPS
ncbi:hypothetical protein [Burkholderia sp. 22PA0106]|uniref:hypothetical protein n=1 Tax=Burkholderia sp. 22PA0106 TaxID=3237371 RepID=UPI0039C3656C